MKIPEGTLLLGMIIKYQIKSIFEKQLMLTLAASWSYQLKDRSKASICLEKVSEPTHVLPGRKSGEVFRNKVDLVLIGEVSMYGK